LIRASGEDFMMCIHGVESNTVPDEACDLGYDTVSILTTIVMKGGDPGEF
jgi:hypothetical protein